MQKNNSKSLDPMNFIDDLIKEMGLQNEAPEKLKVLKENMLINLSRELSEAVSESLDTSAIDQTIEKHGEEKDLFQFISYMVGYSPGAQKAIVDTLDRFYERSIHAHKVLVLGEE